MIEQPQYTAAATGLSRSEWIRLMQCPKCHAYDGDPCVDARGAARTDNHIERVRAADSNIFNTPETTGDDSPVALAFTEAYLLSWQRGPTLARLTAQEQEVGARALNCLNSGRPLLESCHRQGRSLEVIAAQNERPLYFIAKIYHQAVRNLAANAAPLLETCCESCLQQMPEVAFDASLRCPRCLASLPQDDKPIPSALDLDELKASCAALETTWTAPIFEIHDVYQKRLRHRNYLIESFTGDDQRHFYAEREQTRDNAAWKFINSFWAKYGN